MTLYKKPTEHFIDYSSEGDRQATKRGALGTALHMVILARLVNNFYVN